MLRSTVILNNKAIVVMRALFRPARHDLKN